MPRVFLPSVRVDNAAENFLNATQATLESANAFVFNIMDGAILDVTVDGVPRSVVFNAVDFDDITRAPIKEVLAIINAGLEGATAENKDNRILLRSDKYGAASSLEVTAEPTVTGGSASSFDFPVGVKTGSDVTPNQLFLINRIPEHNEVRVPLNSSIVFDLHHPSGASPIPSGVDVYVDGELAYSASGFQLGFSGSVTSLDFFTLRFVVTLNVNFESEVPVTVRVVVPTFTFDDTYLFATLDTTPPEILVVQARSVKCIRVTFNDDVQQVLATDPGDALNPANYIFVHTTKPAVDVVPVRVRPVDSRTVDIETDIELTFGAGYALSIVDVLDTDGNVFITAPDNTLAFTAFSPPIPAGRRFRLIEFLPLINRYEDTSGELRMFIAILQEVTNLLLSDIDRWTDILDLDVAPDNALDAMLRDLGNPFERFALDTNGKRRLLRVLVDTYKQKGTAVGIVNALRFFLSVEVDVRIFNGLGWELAALPSDLVIANVTLGIDIALLDVADNLGVSDQLLIESTAVAATTDATPAGVVDSTATVQSPPSTVATDHVGTSEQVLVTSSALAFAFTVSSASPVDTGPGHELNADTADGVPPAILGPGQSGIYSYEIVSLIDLTLRQVDDIVFVADYMQPAHTHLVQILQPNPPTFSLVGLAVPVFGLAGALIDHLELGFSALGSGPGNPGTFTLH